VFLQGAGAVVSKNRHLVGHQRQERGDQAETIGTAHRGLSTGATYSPAYTTAQAEVISLRRTDRRAL
jgi:hypothetical protein